MCTLCPCHRGCSNHEAFHKHWDGQRWRLADICPVGCLVRLLQSVPWVASTQSSSHLVPTPIGPSTCPSTDLFVPSLPISFHQAPDPAAKPATTAMSLHIYTSTPGHFSLHTRWNQVGFLKPCPLGGRCLPTVRGWSVAVVHLHSCQASKPTLIPRPMYSIYWEPAPYHGSQF